MLTVASLPPPLLPLFPVSLCTAIHSFIDSTRCIEYSCRAAEEQTERRPVMSRAMTLSSASPPGLSSGSQHGFSSQQQLRTHHSCTGDRKTMAKSEKESRSSTSDESRRKQALARSSSTDTVKSFPPQQGEAAMAKQSDSCASELFASPLVSPAALRCHLVLLALLVVVAVVLLHVHVCCCLLCLSFPSLPPSLAAATLLLLLPILSAPCC